MAVSKLDRKRVRAEVEEAVPPSIEDQDLAAPRSSKKARLEDRRSLFVRSIPTDATNESLTEFFSQYFPVKHAVVVVDQNTKQSKGYGFVTFADADDATEAKNALDKKEWDGRRIRLDIAEPRHRNEAEASDGASKKASKKDEHPQPPKLIIRNLPWSIKTPEQLSKLFMSFGKVKFADLPKTKGKLKGFGFVTLRGRKNAETALEAVNGKEVDGRTLAVDWAVDKSTWEDQTRGGKDDEGGSGEDKEEAEETDDGDSIHNDKEHKDGTTTQPRDEDLDADLENFMQNHMQNLDDEDESDEDPKETDDIHEAHSNKPKKQQVDNSSTVFVRNLPFTTTDEQLKSFFSHFGKVRYARVVMDKISEKPAGTGFVCFVNESDAKSCIKEAPRLQQQPATKAKHSVLQDESVDPDGHYTLDGRLLQVAQAVGREEANNLAESSLAQRRQKDKRRLFLLSEGAIWHGSPLHDLLTPAEIQMRQTSANQRKKLVQSNPTLHVSLTRLALRNIPRDIGSKELKELARKAIVGFAKDVKEGKRKPLSKEENARDTKEAKEKEHQRRLKGKGIVRQAKVVFESNQGTKIAENSGAGKSRGYGFIEYTSHHWALMGLRYLNGYQLQGDNGKKQRLVVEFAIENAQVVQRRQAIENQSGRPADATRNGSSNSSDKRGGDADAKANKHVKSKKDRKLPTNVKVEDDEDPTPADPKVAMKQKLIARKRLMRKKKAKSRGQK